MNNERILIVEDELVAAEYLKEMLEAHGFRVLDIISTGAGAIEAARLWNPDLILMDVMLKDSISGSEAAMRITTFCDAKILFLTAHIDEEMVDYAINAAATGYLIKPYNEAQILANIRLALSQGTAIGKQKQGVSDVAGVITLKNGCEYHVCVGRVVHEGNEVELGPRALMLIGLLCRHVNISVSNEQIAMHVYGEAVSDRTLRSLVHRIRKTLGEDVIKNVNGVGYMIVSAG